MTLKDKINADFLEAYKSKNMKKKDFLGVLKGSIQTQEGKQIPATDENVLKVIKSLEKGIVENIDGRKKAGLDVSEQEAELEFLKPYKPTMLTEDEIRVMVKSLIEVSTSKNECVLMGDFNKKNKGKSFDNKVLFEIIIDELKK